LVAVLYALRDPDGTYMVHDVGTPVHALLLETVGGVVGANLIDSMCEQPLKALSPILVTEFPIVIDDNE
jgi:hypothetical protein